MLKERIYNMFKLQNTTQITKKKNHSFNDSEQQTMVLNFSK